MTDDLVSRYRTHSRWSDPGPYAAQLRALPPDPKALAEALHGLVVHPFLYDGPTEERHDDASLRGVPGMLERLFARNAAPLDQARPSEERLLCLCAHFALLTVAVCREWKVPARVRVGFADYFTPGFLEDHWVAEIWTEAQGWQLADTQLGPLQREQFAIDFPSEAVPRDRFLVAADAWQAWRRGDIDDRSVGVSFLDLRGAWFMPGSLQRDAAACALDELLPFDHWGHGDRVSERMTLDTAELPRFDALAEALAAGPETAVEKEAWAERPAKVFSYPKGDRVQVSLN